MPSNLRKFNRKPKFIPSDQWKGAGFYYKRDSKTWQKFSRSIDKERGGKIGRGKARHTHD